MSSTDSDYQSDDDYSSEFSDDGDDDVEMAAMRAATTRLTREETRLIVRWKASGRTKETVGVHVTDTVTEVYLVRESAKTHRLMTVVEKTVRKRLTVTQTDRVPPTTTVRYVRPRHSFKCHGVDLE